MSFHAYLFFGGNCREAFTRYQQIFGGELMIQAMSEAPPGEEPAPPEMADLVMHAALSVGGDLLMASDDPTGGDSGPVQGMQVSYSAPDVERAREVFDALSEGGEVTMAMEEVFWSPAFGMCVDRFGTPWMVSADGPEVA